MPSEGQGHEERAGRKLKTTVMKKIIAESFETHWGGVRTWGHYFTPVKSLGIVVLIHGFGEHCDRYTDSVIPVLLRENWAVLTFDLVGHGRSGGRRGHCRGYGQLMEQLREALEMARLRNPGLPLLLYGHSMGGNLALNYALRHPEAADGIIASSPYLRLAFEPPAWKWHAGKVLRRIAPWVTFPSGLDPNGISRQPEEVAAYRSDPLVHDRVSPAYSFPVIEAGAWALRHAAELQLPLFLAHGTADPIIDPEGSREFHARAPGSELLMVEGGFHELHHDRDRGLFFERLGDWMQRMGFDRD